MRRALEGVRTLFLVSAGEAFDRVKLHTTAVEAAVAAGVEQVVYLSFLNAAPDATFTFARDHFHTEQHVRSTGVRHSFLRPSGYLDYVPFFCSPDGVIRGPAGDGRLAPISRDDLADVAAVVLTEVGRHDGQTYDVTGAEGITLYDAAEQLSLVTGRRVSYHEETLEEARASRAPSGAPDWVIEGWVTSYAAIAAGEMDVVRDTVFRLTGPKPSPNSCASIRRATGTCSPPRALIGMIEHAPRRNGRNGGPTALPPFRKAARATRKTTAQSNRITP
jgi:NAD(P)H dehydrogenase (quinone)